MGERILSKSGMPTRGLILGYAEGCKLRIAALNVDGQKVLGCEFFKFFSPHEVVAFFVERPKPLGIGLRQILALGTGREGWRPADYWIDESPFYQRSVYDEFPFFWGPFQGLRSLEGIALLMALRLRWPDLPATETEPTEYFRHLQRSAAWPTLNQRIATLGRWLNVDLPAELEESDWQAAMSAFAIWMGQRGDWSIDLHRLTRPASERWEWSSADGEQTYQQPALSYDTLLFPAGPVAFYWPPDEREDDER